MTRKRMIMIVVSAAIIVSMGVSSVVSLVSMSKLQHQSDQREALILANRMKEEINGAFAEPVAVSAGMNNAYTIELVKELPSMPQEEASEVVGTYLSQIVDKFGYSTAFMVEGEEKGYYTEHGFNKKIDTHNPDDDWYQPFIKRGNRYELNIDNDQANNNRLTVYINYRMTDENGRCIGACGVGNTLQDLKKSLNTIAVTEGLELRLVSEKGKIQVSTEKEESDKESEESVKKMVEACRKDKQDVFLDGRGNSYSICTYIKECDWYLVITNGNEGSFMKSKLLMNTIIAGFITLGLILGLVNYLISRREDEVEEQRSRSETDILTGLKNRRAFEDTAEALRNKGVVHNVAIGIMDINGLKEVNDTKGHDAGDELIRVAANIIKEQFSPIGEVYRLGGDEFAFISNTHVADPDKLVKEFKNRVAQYNDGHETELSISIGIAATSRDDDRLFVDLNKEADRDMYTDKAAFYNDSRHDRRRR